MVSCREKTQENRIFRARTGSLASRAGNPEYPTLARFLSQTDMEAPSFSHLAWAAPIAAGHGSPRFPTLTLGSLLSWSSVSHACDFGRFPLRPDMETTGFPWLCFWAGSVVARHGNPHVSHACAWAVSTTAGHGNPPRMSNFTLGRLGNPEFHHNYRGFPSRSCTETPNFVATIEVFHCSHTWKLGASHHS